MAYSCLQLHFNTKSKLLALVDPGTQHVSLQGYLPGLRQNLYIFLGMSKNNFSFKTKQNIKEKKNPKPKQKIPQKTKIQTWALIIHFWTELKWSVNFLDWAHLQYKYVKIWISVYCCRKMAKNRGNELKIMYWWTICLLLFCMFLKNHSLYGYPTGNLVVSAQLQSTWAAGLNFWGLLCFAWGDHNISSCILNTSLSLNSLLCFLKSKWNPSHQTQ